MILDNWLPIATLVIIKYTEIWCIIHAPASTSTNEIHHTQLNYNTTINKVILTQRGYIQFLKYYIDVPPLTEYTFCLWINSANLTHSHPLLSYSKHEEERLIRVWITPGGHNLKSEILDAPIFSIPINLVENKWFHICQSWSSYTAIWNVFINGHLLSKGHSPELKGQIIKGDGDIVVGQEYTDFDKGLEDGIEGAVYGFNFVLSPTAHLLEDSHSQSHNHLTPYHKRKKRDERRSELLPPSTSYGVPIGAVTEIPKHAEEPRDAELKLDEPSDRNEGNLSVMTSILQQNDVPFAQKRILFEKVPEVLGGLPKLQKEHKRNLQYKMALDSSDLFTGEGNITYREPKLIVEHSPKDHFYNVFNNSPVKFTDKYVPAKVNKFGHSQMKKSLGLLLVELSRDCNFRKGAPLDGPNVLINWTKTTVRVFGGAILKSIPPFCK